MRMPSTTTQHLARFVLLQFFVDEVLLILAASVEGVNAFFLGDGRSVFHVIVGRTVELFLKNRLLVDGFELGLEVA